MVVLDTLRQIDFRLFEAVNGWAGRWLWLDALGMFASEYLIYVMGLVVMWTAVRPVKPRQVGAILPSTRNWFFPSGMPPRQTREQSVAERGISGAAMVVAACVAAGGGYVVRKFLGEYLGRVRPFSRAIEVTHLSLNLSDGSFPSGHATVAFALAFSVMFARPGWGVFLVFLAVCVSVGRVFTGVHYPGDVVGGMVLGLVSALIARAVAAFFFRSINSKLKSQMSNPQSKAQ